MEAYYEILRIPKMVKKPSNNNTQIRIFAASFDYVKHCKIIRKKHNRVFWCLIPPNIVDQVENVVPKRGVSKTLILHYI